MIVRPLGLLPNTPSKVAHRVGADLHPRIGAALAAGVVGSADLSSYLPPVYTQNGNTCFAHAGAAVAYGARYLAGRPLSAPVSPLAIASLTYSMVRAANTRTLGPLVDTGAELQDAANSLIWGLAPMILPASGLPFTDVPDLAAGAAFPEPSFAQLQESAFVQGQYTITDARNAPLLVAAALDAKILVWNGFYCDSAFMNLQPGQVAPAPVAGPGGGGHSTLIYSYRTNSAGALEFGTRNSWGPSWCMRGDAWVSSAWISAAWNLWPFTLAVY